MKTRTTYGRREGGVEAINDEVASAPLPTEEDTLLDEVIRLAREPLELEGEPGATEALALDNMREMVAAGRISDEAFAAAVAAIASTHENATTAIREMLVAAGEQRNGSRSDWLTAAALATLDKFAQRPDPPAPDIHVHVPKQDLSVHVDTPDFKPEITVEGANIHVPPHEPVQVDVHVPETPAPQITVAAATPEVVVQPAAAPVVNVNMPDEIRTIPAEVETVAERDADDLLVRSVTRPTGE